MNCNLWRSHGRIFCSQDLSLLFTVLVGRNFMSGIYKLKP